MMRLFSILALAAGVAGCVAAPPYGYEPAPAYGDGPGYYAPRTSIGIGVGGDHSVTLAELRVLAKRHGPLALVQLDAHADTWEAYFGQKYFHGTTFKRAVEEDLLDATASVMAGMRGSVYAASDLGTAR